jgi:hypothetical protein
MMIVQYLLNKIQYELVVDLLTLQELKMQIAKQRAEQSLTSLETETIISLIYKGKKLDAPDSTLVSDLIPISNQLKPIKLLVLATTTTQIAGLQDRITRHDQALLNYQRALVSRPKHEIISQGRARTIQVLGEFPDHEKARQVLIRIRDDPAIKQIMTEREWYVLELIELHPIRDASILGYNRNKGGTIALRLRTDELDRFRSYSSIVGVMLHELSHMVWSEHDENFHRLDRELNANYIRYQGRKMEGSSTSTSSSAAAGLVAGPPRTLGGSRPNPSIPLRELLANAAKLRLTREEEEMEKSCGKG